MKTDSIQSLNDKQPGMIVLAAACLLALLILNAYLIFSEGWSFDGFPHSYQISALQQFYDRSLETADGDDSFFPVGHFNDNPRFSPYYRLGGLLAGIGRPTPAWFRLAGLLFPALTFIAAYLLLPRPNSALNRLVVALAVSTTPVVLFIARYLEDHSLHIFLLVAAAAVLSRTDLLRRGRIAWIFYLIPAAGLLLTHMVTNFLVMMTSFSGLYLYVLIIRFKEDGPGAAWRQEWPRLLVGFFLLIVICWHRLDFADLFVFIRYYFQQSTAGLTAHLSWLRRALAYPQIIAFSACGPVVCLLALLAIFKRLRAERLGLYLLWALLPLVLLTPVDKKNAYYAWYLAPAFSLIAAQAVIRMPLKVRQGFVVLCLILAGMHLFWRPSPTEPLVDKAPFDLENPYPLIPIHVYPEAEILGQAQRVLDLAARCGPLDGRPLTYFLDNPESGNPAVYFAMLHLDQKPRYWLFEKDRAVYPPGLIAVEIPNPDPSEQAEKEPWLMDIYQRIVSGYPAWRDPSGARVFCADPSAGVDRIR